jgi:hypothetical protein
MRDYLLDEEGQLILIPEEILEVREKRLRNRDIKEYLIKWKKFAYRGCHLGK